jgi:hypothetical protein
MIDKKESKSLKRQSSFELQTLDEYAKRARRANRIARGRSTRVQKVSGVVFVPNWLLLYFVSLRRFFKFFSLHVLQKTWLLLFVAFLKAARSSQQNRKPVFG